MKEKGLSGVVRFWNKEKFYGFISYKQGGHWFQAYFNKLGKLYPRQRLKSHDVVKFDLQKSNRGGYKAINVAKVKDYETE